MNTEAWALHEVTLRQSIEYNPSKSEDLDGFEFIKEADLTSLTVHLEITSQDPEDIV